MGFTVVHPNNLMSEDLPRWLDLAEARPPHDPRILTSLGKYRLIGRLGQGGMGVVYEAEDTALERKVAIKVLTDRMSNDPDLCERFQKEARAGGRGRIADLAAGAAGLSHRASWELPWAACNAASGETWPTLGRAR